MEKKLIYIAVVDPVDDRGDVCRLTDRYLARDFRVELNGGEFAEDAVVNDVPSVGRGLE